MATSASPVSAKAPAGRGLRRRLADTCTAAAAILGLKLLYHLPERLAWSLATFAGDLSYRLSRGRRDHARRNLRRVVEWMAANGAGDDYHRAAATNPRRLEALLRDAFRNHVRYYVELARAPRFTPAYVNARLHVETMAEVDELLTIRRAMILVGLHFGAIEFPGLFAVSRVGAIVTPMETVSNARIQRYVFSTRATIGVHIIPLDQARELIATLRRDEPIGLVADRDLTGGGIEVELFGGKTKIPAGPALLAAESGAPICVAAVRRAGRGKYLGKLYGVVVPEGVTRREKSRVIVREEARLFERLISDAPEQWLALFHPVWPDLEGTVAGSDSAKSPAGGRGLGAASEGERAHLDVREPTERSRNDGIDRADGDTKDGAPSPRPPVSDLGAAN